MNTREEMILVIESAPDAAIRRWLQRALTPYQLVLVEGHEQALEAASRRGIDLIMLRLDKDEQAAHLAHDIALLRQCANVPVIVLSQVEDAHYAACILDAGADDYVRSSVGLAELGARCRAILRRAQLLDQTPTALQVPPLLCSRDAYLRIHLDQRQVFAGPQHVRLTKTEFNLLAQMMSHAGKILTHRWLLQAVWGSQYDGQSNYLRVYICQLRSKVEPNPARPRYIHTLTGVGYVFQ